MGNRRDDRGADQRERPIVAVQVDADTSSQAIELMDITP
jgi:hypothetical protein